MTETREEKGARLAEELADFVNVAYKGDREVFVQGLMKQHRTLQQEIFLLFLEACREWDRQYRLDNYDARNEYTVKQSSVIVNELSLLRK